MARTGARPAPAADGFWDRPALMNLVADVLIFFAVAGLAWAAVTVVQRLPVFPLRQLVLTGEVQRVTHAQLDDAARAALAGNFFTVDLNGAREAFDREELALREALEYPPFASMVTLEAVGAQGNHVREIAGHWARLLRKEIEARSVPADRAVLILGPVQAGSFRARARSCWRLMVKGRDGAIVRSLVRSSLEQLAEEAARHRVKLCVDVDPLNPD